MICKQLPSSTPNPRVFSMKEIADLYSQLSEQKPHLESLNILTDQCGLIEDFQRSYLILECFDRDEGCSKMLNILVESEETKGVLIEIESLFQQVQKELEHDCFLRIFDVYFYRTNIPSQSSSSFLVIESEVYQQKIEYLNSQLYEQTVYSYFKECFQDKLNWGKDLIHNQSFRCQEGDSESYKKKFNLISPKFIKGITLEKETKQKVTKIVPKQINYKTPQFLIDTSRWQSIITKFYQAESQLLGNVFKHIEELFSSKIFSQFRINATNSNEINMTVLSEDNQLLNIHYHQLQSNESAQLIKKDYEKLIKMRKQLDINSEVKLIEVSPEIYLVEIKETVYEKTQDSSSFLETTYDYEFVRSFCSYMTSLLALSENGYDKYLNPNSIWVDIEKFYFMNPLHLKKDYRRQNIQLIIQCFAKLITVKRIQSSNMMRTFFQNEKGFYEELLSIQQEKISDFSFYKTAIDNLRKISLMLKYSTFLIKNNWEIAYQCSQISLIIFPQNSEQFISKLTMSNSDYHSSTQDIDIQVMTNTLLRLPNLNKLHFQYVYSKNLLNLQAVKAFPHLTSLKIQLSTLTDQKLLDLFSCEEFLSKLKTLYLYISFKFKSDNIKELNKKQLTETFVKEYQQIKKSLSPNMKKLSVFIKYELLSDATAIEQYLIQAGALNIDERNKSVENEDKEDKNKERVLQNEQKENNINISNQLDIQSSFLSLFGNDEQKQHNVNFSLFNAQPNQNSLFSLFPSQTKEETSSFFNQSDSLQNYQTNTGKLFNETNSIFSQNEGKNQQQLPSTNFSLFGNTLSKQNNESGLFSSQTNQKSLFTFTFSSNTQTNQTTVFSNNLPNSEENTNANTENQQNDNTITTQITKSLKKQNINKEQQISTNKQYYEYQDYLKLVEDEEQEEVVDEESHEDEKEEEKLEEEQQNTVNELLNQDINKQEELQQIMDNPIILQFIQEMQESSKIKFLNFLRQQFKSIMRQNKIDFWIGQGNEKTIIVQIQNKKYQDYEILRVELNDKNKIVNLYCRSQERFECYLMESNLQKQDLIFNDKLVQKWQEYEMQTNLSKYLIGDDYKPSCSHQDYHLLQQQLYKNQTDIQSLNIDIMKCEYCIRNRTFSLGLDPVIHVNLSKLTLQFLDQIVDYSFLKYTINQLKMLPNLTNLKILLPYIQYYHKIQIRNCAYKLRRLLKYKMNNY